MSEANGQAGELLVQEQLLLHGIESAPLTTDTGINLVAYSPRRSGNSREWNVLNGIGDRNLYTKNI